MPESLAFTSGKKGSTTTIEEASTKVPLGDQLRSRDRAVPDLRKSFHDAPERKRIRVFGLLTVRGRKHMTSDQRVAGSSPAGCKMSLIKE